MTRLFIPGPTDVDPKVLAAQTQPMVGHRSQTFIELFARIQPRLREVFRTPQRVYITASSGTGLLEGAMRSCVAERVLTCVCGAFGERWAVAAEANGMPFERLDAEWGRPNTPDQVEAALRANRYDTLVMVHNETSTGVENPIAEIARMARTLVPEIVIMVDAVSSAGGVLIETEAWDLDVVVTSSQKCFALPPGLALGAVSDRALARAETVPYRGWYFDLVLLEKYLQRNFTPATPAISLLHALDRQLERMLDEGMEARFQRHGAMADRVRGWASDRFGLFAAEGFRSQTVTAVANSGSLDVPRLNAFLAQDGMTISDGYGALKGRTFRIAHMGETQPRDVELLLDRIDAFLQS